MLYKFNYFNKKKLLKKNSSYYLLFQLIPHLILEQLDVKNCSKT